jgi:hypothetical protein
MPTHQYLGSDDKWHNCTPGVRHSFAEDGFDTRILADTEEAEAPDDSSPICTNCSGSGEGMYDGTRCSACSGLGVQKPHAEETDEDYAYEEARQARLDGEGY